jgi:wobble nucleotide-excising tRNase
MEKQNKTEQLEKAIKKQQEEIDKLKKVTKRQKWWNVWIAWR